MSFNATDAVTVTASPATITFTSTDSEHATVSGPITIVTTWNLVAAGESIYTDAYFTSPTAALTGTNSNVIPASDLFASIDGRAASACNQTDPNVTAAVAGATCSPVFFEAGILQTGTNTDTIVLSIVSGTAIPADSYTGTFTISSQTT
jgi:hypothetical protein